MGRLIPAGTGVPKYRSANLLIEDPEEYLPEVEEIDEEAEGDSEEVVETVAAAPVEEGEVTDLE
jgi:DNA-directed RNA polymerase subunit beta'